jgi:ribosome-binding protein aMBF1 (putative translation factor)
VGLLVEYENGTAIPDHGVIGKIERVLHVKLPRGEKQKKKKKKKAFLIDDDDDW